MHHDDFYNNLVAFLKMFKNRPNHLAKYLLDNSAINKDFLKKIANNDELKSLSTNDEKLNSPIYFADIIFEDLIFNGILNQFIPNLDITDKSKYPNDINKMNDYYNSFTDDIKKLNKGKTPDEIEDEMNDKLNSLIFNEKYEDAARLRDYMQRNEIKRNKN